MFPENNFLIKFRSYWSRDCIRLKLAVFYNSLFTAVLYSRWETTCVLKGFKCHAKFIRNASLILFQFKISFYFLINESKSLLRSIAIATTLLKQKKILAKANLCIHPIVYLIIIAFVISLIWLSNIRYYSSSPDSYWRCGICSSWNRIQSSVNFSS